MDYCPARLVTWSNNSALWAIYNNKNNKNTTSNNDNDNDNNNDNKNNIYIYTGKL